MTPIINSIALSVLVAIQGPNYTTKTIRSKAIKKAEIQISYPQFTGSTPLIKLANRSIEKEYKFAMNAFIQETKEYTDVPKEQFYFKLQAKPSANGLGILSVRGEADQASGGAHGFHFFRTVNVGQTAKGPKVLKLADLFKPGTDLKKVIGTPIIEALKKDERAMFVQNGEKKELAPEDYESFIVTRTSIRFLFEPYNMGPWAAGSIEYDFPLSQLKPYLLRG